MTQKNNLFNWEPKYQLHVDQMDNEHKRLIALMNDLFEMHQHEVTYSAIEVKLNELFNYTVTHFKHEEKYFTSLPYEKAESHKIIHRNLIEKLEKHSEKIKKNQKISEDFFDFLKVWLSAHIVGIDQGYASVSRASEKKTAA